jgi:hypothetical protein
MAYSVQQLTLGGGIFYLAPRSGDIEPDVGGWTDETGSFNLDYGDFNDLGAVPDVKASVKVDVAEHYTNRDGPDVKDAQDPVQTGLTWKISCDQLNQDTLAMFFLGAKSGARTVYHLTNPMQEFALKVVPRYTRGEKWTHHMHRGVLKPTGDASFFTRKEYGKLDFEIEALADYANHSNDAGDSVFGYSSLPETL